MSDEIDFSPEEEAHLESAWGKLESQLQQEGGVFPLADQTTPPERRAEHLSKQPLDHEESVVLLSSIYQARAEGRDADIPTLMNYFNDPASFRKIMWDAARRGRNQ